MMQGTSLGLENLSALVDKIQLLVDPQAVASRRNAGRNGEDEIAPAGDAPAIARGRATSAGSDCRVLQPLGALKPNPASGAPSASADRQIVLRSDEHPGAYADGQGGISDRRRPVLRTAGRQAFQAAGGSPRRKPAVIFANWRISSIPRRVARRRRSRCSNRSSNSSDTPSPPARCRCCAIVHVPSPSGISWPC